MIIEQWYFPPHQNPQFWQWTCLGVQTVILLLNLPNCRCWIRPNWQKVSVVVFGDLWPKGVLQLVDFLFLPVRIQTFQTRCHRTALWLSCRFIPESRLSPILEGEASIFRTCGCWWRRSPLKQSVSTCL
jgi:hypothetical protein